MWDTVRLVLTEHAVPLGAMAAILTIVEIVFSPIRATAQRWRKPEQVEIVNLPPAPKGQLTVAEFVHIRREMRADLLAELATADPAEAVILRRRVDELERQIADPDPALAAVLAEVASLKARLEREGNQIGADRLRAAEEAMDRLDFSLADALFAEVEERQKLEIQTAARAAFGRGEIAEAEIRWADAATHYARAAQLDPMLKALHNATQLTLLAGEYGRAERLAQDYVTLARASGDPNHLYRALDGHATALYRLTHHAEAEALYRQALDIGRETIGVRHQNYACVLGNLALAVQAQGRHAEAKALLVESLEICEAIFGPDDPDVSIHLNNFALLVRANGRHEDAEEAILKALEIDRATFGECHPRYAHSLSNLAFILGSQGRYSDAERFHRAALAIDRATIGEGHPDYAIGLKNLAWVLVKLDRPNEARPLYQQVLSIRRKILPSDHPHIQSIEKKLSQLP